MGSKYTRLNPFTPVTIVFGSGCLPTIGRHLNDRSDATLRSQKKTTAPSTGAVVS